MTFRQEVKAALEHRQTALTPWTFELTSDFRKLYSEAYGVDDPESDLEAHIMFGKYKPVTWLEDDLYEDIFGVRWKLGADGGDIGIPVNKVMDFADRESYRFPEIDDAELEKGLSAMRADTEHFRMFRMTYTLYERVWSLAGMMETLMGMAADGGAVTRVFERVSEYQHKLLGRILDEDFEGVYFGDDYGQQRGLIMGAAHFREFIKPWLKELCDRVRGKGKYVALHCCGDISEILPDLIEIGVNAYNTVQPEIYDLAFLKREYGKDLTYWGAVSTQQFLPGHSADEVYDKSVETIRTLGEGGGYIFSPTHAVTPDIPVGNIRAMHAAVKDVTWI
jgi:uroporphyrinogen decarboxylase